MRLYGAHPLHLALHLLVFAVSAFALVQILDGGVVENFLIWFVGAALLHDLVFLPLYTLADHAARRFHIPALNYLRVPALISGVLLLVYFPLILVKADGNYFRSTGHHVEHYARNWLLITVALFAGSALVYLSRGLYSRRTSSR
jgi:hypothetical protein